MRKAALLEVFIVTWELLKLWALAPPSESLGPRLPRPGLLS